MSWHDPDLDDMPEIAWQYWGCIDFMIEYPGMYSLDEKRSDLHNKLCSHYKLAEKKV